MYRVLIRQINEPDRIESNFYSIEGAYNAAINCANERANFFIQYGIPSAAAMTVHFTRNQAQYYIEQDGNPIMMQSPGMVPLISSQYVQIVLQKY